ncbi:MAG TPA: DUF4145 domain-containing protein [Bryobacteraceae bacterium]|nr:DUF4145 domain-containing protein [Bryobacteraceae bacterium]
MAETFLCYHCGNIAAHKRIGLFEAKELFENVDGRPYRERFKYEIYRCSTCDGINIFGDFIEYPHHKTFAARRLYPRGSLILPEDHKLASAHCIPERILQLYEQTWPLRHVSPGAFAGQIRRALELVCRDQQAKGSTLFLQLKDLVARGTFPGYFAEITDLLRQGGNLGAHAGDEDVDFWDAELLDDFFRSVIEYVYVAPAKIARLKTRLGAK